MATVDFLLNIAGWLIRLVCGDVYLTIPIGQPLPVIVWLSFVPATIVAVEMMPVRLSTGLRAFLVLMMPIVLWNGAFALFAFDHPSAPPPPEAVAVVQIPSTRHPGWFSGFLDGLVFHLKVLGALIGIHVVISITSWIAFRRYVKRIVPVIHPIGSDDENEVVGYLVLLALVSVLSAAMFFVPSPCLFAIIPVIVIGCGGLCAKAQSFNEAFVFLCRGPQPASNFNPFASGFAAHGQQAYGSADDFARKVEEEEEELERLRREREAREQQEEAARRHRQESQSRANPPQSNQQKEVTKLRRKLAAIDATIQCPGTDGERQAALDARERILKALRSLSEPV